MPASTQTIVEGCSGPAGAGNGSTSAATAPKCPERYTRTQAVLHGMFTENVGGHFLDSGDTYGRLGDAYRAAPDMLDRPEIAACGDDGLLDGGEEDKAVPAERSTFHALDANLEYSAELDAEFERFCAEHDGADGLNWVDLAERFASSRDAAFSREGGVHNTYEFENLLDAPCQWFEFDALVRREGSGGSSVADGPRQCRAVLVQIHLGCDIRGGYGRPRAFVMRRGKWLRHAARAFDAACECTQIECWGDGVVYNAAAASECEACAHGGDETDCGPEPEGCICGEFPAYWKPSGRSDGSLQCAECGAAVDVS